MKKRVLSYLGVICMCLHILSGTVFADVINSTGNNAFPDVPANAEYAEAVNALHECGIINGDEKGNFNPNSSVTRAEAAAIICRLLGMSEEAKQANTTKFSDVPSNHWANGYVAVAAKQEIINGYGNGKFGPSDSVTYAQMLKMLVCAWGYEKESQSAGGWPNGYVEIAQNIGISKNVNITDSSKYVIRSNVAVLCYNTLNIAPGNFLDTDI